MTREEAIAVLNMVEAHGRLLIEAKDMAIKALEQPCEDCVSRQSMLDAITEIDDNTNMDIYTNEVREIIKDLPSVTPTHTETVTEFADRCRECGKQKKGKWIYHEKSISTGFKDLRECSCCKCYFDWLMPRNSYCPNCGAEMESEE